MKEIWKNIKNYEEYYQISNFGKIKSLTRQIIRDGNGGVQASLIKERILKPRASKGNYYYVNLWKNGKRIMVKIHQLVAEYFIPNPEGKSWVHHKDRNKLNNYVDNLEWNTPQEHMLQHGIGKLTKKDILQIYNLYPQYSYKKIGEKFNVSGVNTIHNIIKGKTWKYLLKYNNNDIKKDFRELGRRRKRKLTTKDVQYIRNNYPQLSTLKLAIKFQVNHNTISDIIHKKTYKNI